MPQTPPNLIAGGTIRPSRFVRIDATAAKTCREGSATCQVIGISQTGTNYPPLSDIYSTTNAATNGQYVQLFGDGDVCLLEAGDSITTGDRLKSDSVGSGVTILTTGTTNQNVGAVALEDASAAGELILVQVATLRSVRPT